MQEALDLCHGAKRSIPMMTMTIIGCVILNVCTVYYELCMLENK